MAAELFFLPFPTAFNSNGAPVSGAKLYFYVTGTLDPAPVYTTAGLNVEHEHPVVARSSGRFPQVYLDDTVTYRLRITDASDVLLEDVDPYIPGVSSAVISATAGISVSTRSALAAFADPVDRQSAFLSESGREGWFVFNSANFSSSVETDERQGIFVPPASDTTGASGAWVRVHNGDVLPEWFGAARNGSTSDLSALKAAASVAGVVGGNVRIQSGTYITDGRCTVPDGVNISGPRSAIIKRANQVRTTTTSEIASGGTSISFTVASATGLRVGQSIMFVWNGGSNVLPLSAFSHQDIEITDISGLTVTALRNGHTGGIPSGATVQTTGHLFVLQGNNRLEGFTIDGNESNQTEAYWISHVEVTQEGDNCTLKDIRFQNTFSDAHLAGGPDEGLITGCTVDNCEWENIGGNASHTGNIDNVTYINPQINGCNKHKSGINVAHNDGGLDKSDNVYRYTVLGGCIEDCIAGVAAFGSHNDTVNPSYPNINDYLNITGTTFKNCFRGIEGLLNTKLMNISTCTFEADYTPSGPQPINDTFASSTAIYLGGDVHGQLVHRININGIQLTNCRLVFEGAHGVTVTNFDIDHRAIMDSNVHLAGIGVYNCRHVKFAKGMVRGGVIGAFLQSAYEENELSATYSVPVGPDAGDAITFDRVTFQGQITGAVAGNLLDTDDRLDAVFEGCIVKDSRLNVGSQAGMLALGAMEVGDVVRRTDVSSGWGRYRLTALPASTLANWTSIATWYGFTMTGGMMAFRNWIWGNPDRALIGQSRRVQNTQGNHLNGVVGTGDEYAAFTAYTSTTHVVNDGSNVAVVDLGSGVYEVTKDAGGDTNNGNANTTTWFGDDDWDIEIEPQAANIRGIIGVETGDQTDSSVNNFDFAVNFFWNGTTSNVVTSGGFTDLPSNTTVDTFSAGQKWRLGQRDRVLSLRKNGTDFDDADVVWTANYDVEIGTQYRLRTSLRTVGGVWEIKVFG